jgi:hypothetical protein
MYLMHVACDRVMDQSRSLCRPMCDLGYISYVNLILSINLELVLSILCSYHVLSVG